MRRQLLHRRPAVRALAALVLACLLLPAAVGPAAAKEGMLAHLDAPIALDSPPGAELLVGMRVTVLTEDGEMPVEGSPIVLILTGRYRARTEAAGEVRSRTDTSHYVMRITVPEGGVQHAQVVIRGSGSGGKRIDLDIPFTSDPFTAGPITASTAQLAPGATPAPTARPVETSVATVPAASVPAVAAAPVGAATAPSAAPGTAAAVTADPTSATGAGDESSWWLPALASLVLGVAVVLAVRLRSGGRPAEGT